MWEEFPRSDRAGFTRSTLIDWARWDLEPPRDVGSGRFRELVERTDPSTELVAGKEDTSRILPEDVCERLDCRVLDDEAAQHGRIGREGRIPALLGAEALPVGQGRFVRNLGLLVFFQQ